GIDAHGDGGVAERGRDEGMVQFDLQRSRQSFLPHTQGRAAGRYPRGDRSRTGDERSGYPDDTCLLAAGSRPKRTELWDLAGTASPRVAIEATPHARAGQCVFEGSLHWRVQ